MSGVELVGVALHDGCPTSVVLVRRPGPVALRQRGVEVPLSELQIDRTDYGVVVVGGVLRVDLVEHLFAAVGGLGIGGDLRVDVGGSEVPLLDGGAARFVRALRELGLPVAPPRMRVTRVASFEVGGTCYRFSPSERTELRVEVDFDHPLVVIRRACWDGDSDDFSARIAPARTFGFRRDAEALRRAGRARAVDPRAVVILDDDGGTPSDPPPAPDECARHKLLDLVGDLVLSGGLVRGRIEAFRPGHGATRRALALAREAGVIV